MEMGAEESWQEILDVVTAKAEREGLVRAVKMAKSPEDRIRKILESITIRNRMATWISRCAESRYQKSGGTASKLRDEGNLKFRAHDNEACLKLYTESVICAGEFGPELCLAYANRSATLYHLGHFDECLRDIRLALKYKYPKNLEYKLHQRRGQCLARMGQFEAAKDSYNLAISALEMVPKLSRDKKEALIRDMNALTIEAKLCNQKKPELEEDKPPTVPTAGENASFPAASNLLELRNDGKGYRFVVAAKDIQVGDILFLESPYSSVLLPNFYSTHCHHCIKTFVSPVACLKCTQPRFCSEDCRLEAWESYHKYECANLDLVHSVGIAHLALRTVLITGLDRLLLLKKTDDDDNRDTYDRVSSLVDHMEELNPVDLFQYVVTATLLTTFLDRRTKFFSSSESLLKNLTLNTTSTTSTTEATDEELFVFVAGIMLKHICQLICNGSAVFEVLPENDGNNDPVYSVTQQRISTGIYPSSSMLNHSCNPNVVNCFYRNRMIVRAIRKIPKGSEVFNCYGPHFRRHMKKERQEILKSQYHFVCQCDMCRLKTEFLDRFSALKCHYCGGPVVDSDGADDSKGRCMDCEREQEYVDRVRDVFRAYELFKAGSELLDRGDLNDAIPLLQSCYQMRIKAMYAHHREITEVANELSRCYASMGLFQESAQYLQVTLPAVMERFGGYSLEYGHELNKYADVMIGGLQEGRKRTSRFQEKLREVQACLEKAAQIFELHYGEWNKTYQETAQKLEKTHFIVN